jgi:hypothetical protein
VFPRHVVGCPLDLVTAHMAVQPAPGSAVCSDYNSAVTAACVEGYYFTGEHDGRADVTLTCLYGGIWDVALPQCISEWYYQMGRERGRGCGAGGERGKRCGGRKWEACGREKRVR